MEVAKKLIENVKETVGDGKKTIREVKEDISDVIEDRKEIIEELFERTEDYIRTNIDLAKLRAADKVAEVIGSIATQVTLIVLAYIFLLMLTFGIAYWIGSLVGQTYMGFLIVAGFYLLLSLTAFVFRKQLIKSPVSNIIISQFLK